MTDSIDNKDAALYLENVHKHNIAKDSEFLLSQLKLRNSMYILDVGYGTGNLLFKLKNTLYDINAYGVEKSEALFEHSREQLQKAKVNIFCEDFEAWSTGERFDIIIMSFYLHHVGDFSKHLAKAISMLKSDGTVIILDRIALNDKSKEEFRVFWEQHYASAHEWQEECPGIFTREELISSLKSMGYAPEAFVLVPMDNRKGTENFPKTVAVIKRIEAE